jgi:hypothetical protein
MQCFTETVQRAAANAYLTATYQYAVLRMAELLDAAAPLGVSATMLLDTQTVVIELDTCLRGYAAPTSRYDYNQLERALRGATVFLRRDATLRTFYGQTFVDLMADLAKAEAIRKLALPAAARRTRFDALLAASLTTTFSAFRDRVTSTGTDYRHKLRARLVIALRNPSPTPAEWNRLDGDLSRICGTLLAEGRDGPSIVSELAAGLGNAQTTTEAEHVLKQVVRGRPRNYQVAMFIDGVRGRATPAADGLVDLPSTLRWATGATSASNKRLRDLGRRIKPARGMGIRARVRASDPGQARLLALESAERVVTRILHEHRVGEVDLLKATVVLDETSGLVQRLPPLYGPIRGARVSDRGHLQSLVSAMHYFGLGRRDPSALGANVNLWTALENLAQGYQQTEAVGKFVPTHVEPLAALVAARQVFVHARRLLTLELRQQGRPDPNGLADWLRPMTGGSGLARIRDLLAAFHGTSDADATRAAPLAPGASATDAARVLREFVGRCSCHVRRRLEGIAALLADQRRFRAHLEDIGEMAAHHSDRMRLMRNRTVHQTLVTAEGAHALRQIGLLIVDAALEVLPMWTRPREPPFKAMHRVLVWRGNLGSQWGAGHPIDPDYLVRQP